MDRGMTIEFNRTFERIVNYNNKRAYKNGSIGTLTIEEVHKAYEYFDGRCAYSGLKIDRDFNFSLEHIIPIISGGHSVDFNCIPVIKKYNSSKSGYHLLDWWKCQNDGRGNTVYNPYRLLKIVNYILKSLKSINDEKDYILQENKIDEFLRKNLILLSSNIQPVDGKDETKKLSSIEVMKKFNMKTLEEEYPVFESIGSIKVDLDIFLAESIDFMKHDIKDESLINELEKLFNSIDKICIADKEIYYRNEKKIETNRILIRWLKANRVENIFGIAGYCDLNFLMQQENLEEYLEIRKKEILKIVGIDENNFNYLINKVPNILTNLDLDHQIACLINHFAIENFKDEKGTSELYRYLIKKPELLFSSEIIERLATYASIIKIDKKMLRRGMPLSIMLDNLEAILDIVNEADLNVNSETRKRIIKKFFENSNGNSVRLAYENLKRRAQKSNEQLKEEEIITEAARWIVCISEKYDSSKIFKERCINKTKKLYKDMKFDEDGYMIGVNKNAYYVPKIVELANLDIPKEAESVLIEDVFTSSNVKKGVNVNFIFDFLKNKVRAQKPNLSEEKVAQEAARWLIFISENAYIMLDVLYNPDIREEYVEKTVKYYKNMIFDERGNYINVKIDGLAQDSVGIDYMNIVDMFFNTDKENCYIAGKKIKKSEVYSKLYKHLEVCKNKKMVREACLKTLKQLSTDIKKNRKRGKNNGDKEH